MPILVKILEHGLTFHKKYVNLAWIDSSGVVLANFCVDGSSVAVLSLIVKNCKHSFYSTVKLFTYEPIKIEELDLRSGIDVPHKEKTKFEVMLEFHELCAVHFTSWNFM